MNELKSKLEELRAILNTNSLTDWSENDASDEFSELESLVSDIIEVVPPEPQREVGGFQLGDIEHQWNEDNEYFEKKGEPRIPYTDELGEKVMDYLEHSYDANYGVDWDRISYAIDEIIKEKK